MLQSMRSAAKYIWIFAAGAFVIGFLLLDTSGLIGREQVTASTPVGSVNGREILYTHWDQRRQQLMQRAQQQGGALTLDEQRQIEDEAFSQIVNEILIADELERRGITVSDDEIRQAAEFLPPPEITRNPEFQTEGRFDPDKYRRFRTSPLARQQGFNVYLEAMYRQEIPRQKLYAQIASTVYVTDAQLWQMYQDQHDSAQVTFTVLRPETVPDSAVSVSDAEIRAYFEEHQKEFERPGRAVLSLIALPRTITAADTAATRARIEALRAEILGGASFEDVARRESADSASAANGGLLPPSTRGRFVPEFENAAWALRAGQISAPVLSPFGYHIIKLDERKGDTLTLRHILLPIRQSDSSAVRVDRRADSLASIGGNAEEPARFDSAAKVLGTPVLRVVATEGEPVFAGGRYVPSVSAWAFGGARVNESSELFDSEEGYFLARLDSLRPGGKPKLENVREDIKRVIMRRKKVEQLVPVAQKVAAAAVAGSLEQAAGANSLQVQQTPMFTRGSMVPGIGRLNRAIGAAFAVPVGAVSAPISTDDGVYILRVDRRKAADKATWEAQKATQRAMVRQQFEQQEVQQYLAGLRQSAEVEDRRKEVYSALRQQSVE